MEKEHCKCQDSNVVFTTFKNKVTSRKKERIFVVEGIYDAKDIGRGLVIRDVDMLLEKHNKKVNTTSSPLTRAEVIAVVLYTGPMVSRPFSHLHL